MGCRRRCRWPKPAATKRPSGPVATERRVAVVAPDGLDRSCSVQCWPSGESQIVWQSAIEPTAMNPPPVATAAAAYEGAPVALTLAQFFRSADHQKAACSVVPLPCLPTTR